MQKQMQKNKNKNATNKTMDSLTPKKLIQLLYNTLIHNNDTIIQTLTHQTMQRFTSIKPNQPVGSTYYLYQTLQNLNLKNILEKLIKTQHQQLNNKITPLKKQLKKNEFDSRIEQFKKKIKTKIHQHLITNQNTKTITKTLHKPLPKNIDFMHASRDKIQTLKKSLYPLTHKLATRLTHKRHHKHKNPLDFHNTIHHSLSYNNVPTKPKFKFPHPTKPELVVITNISDSVTAFTQFTLILIYTIQNQFSKIRSFVFINNINKITKYFHNINDISNTVHQMNTKTNII